MSSADPRADMGMFSRMIHFIVDTQTWLAYEMKAYREKAVACKTFETTMLICNCGVFHGLLDKNGLIDVFLMLALTEWIVIFKVPMSLCRTLEWLLCGASIVQLMCVHVHTTQMAFAYYLRDLEMGRVGPLLVTTATGGTALLAYGWLSTTATKWNIFPLIQEHRYHHDTSTGTGTDTGRALDALAEVLNQG
jgi:hypothetical protein